MHVTVIRTWNRLVIACIVSTYMYGSCNYDGSICYAEILSKIYENVNYVRRLLDCRFWRITISFTEEGGQMITNYYDIISMK